MVLPGISEPRWVPGRYLPAGLLLWLIAAQALAQEPMLAHIRSVNPGTGEIVVRLDNEKRDITLPMSQETDAKALEPGTLVRVWPAQEGTLDGISGSVRITPVHGDSRLNDRTGVRGRLRRIGGSGARTGGGRGGR